LETKWRNEKVHSNCESTELYRTGWRCLTLRMSPRALSKETAQWGDRGRHGGSWNGPKWGSPCGQRWSR
jgi:hypothetical protein